MWYAWIQNKEIHVVLMYVFPIKPSMVPKWHIFAKMWGCAQILAPGVSNRRRMFELENQPVQVHFTSSLSASLAGDSKTKMSTPPHFCKNVPFLAPLVVYGKHIH